VSLEDYLEQAQVDFTLHQVADLLNVSYDKVLKLRAAGAFPNAYKAGPSNRAGWRVPAKDVREYVAQLRQNQPPTTPENET
jgi:hypothetical protein